METWFWRSHHFPATRITYPDAAPRFRLSVKPSKSSGLLDEEFPYYTNAQVLTFGQDDIRKNWKKYRAQYEKELRKQK